MQNMLSFNLIYNSALFECIRDNWCWLCHVYASIWNNSFFKRIFNIHI